MNTTRSSTAPKRLTMHANRGLVDPEHDGRDQPGLEPGVQSYRRTLPAPEGFCDAKERERASFNQVQ